MVFEIKLVTLSKEDYYKVISENKSPFLIIKHEIFRNKPIIELFLTDTEEKIVNSILGNSIEDFILETL